MISFNKYIYFLFIFMGLFGIGRLGAQVLSTKVSVDISPGKLTSALGELRKAINIGLYYDPAQVGEYSTGRQSFRGQPLNEVLLRLFQHTALEFEESKGSITIRKRLSSDDGIPDGGNGQGQPGTVQGAVRDSLGKSLAGVTVKVKGNARLSTTTDENGLFILKVPAGSQALVFTQIGFKEQEVPLSRLRRDGSVLLQSDPQSLEEVVVMGFGIKQNKASLVGAVETVRAEDLVTSSSNLSTAFAGRIAGVIATQSSGEPGVDGANFWIRGISTFGANSSPLIILDGVEVVTEILNSLAPETIESFSVLKDATATALYGSRGANGVMVITTKSGANLERMNVNVRAESTLSAPTKIQQIADGVTYMENYNEAYRDANGRNYFSDDKIAGTKAGLDPYIYPNNDWYSLLFKDYTFNQNANINVTGGTNKVDYFLNASMFRENGIYKQVESSTFNNNNQLTKFSFQSNVSANITPTTKVGVKMNSMLQYRHRPTESSSNLFYYSMRANPVAFPVTFPAEKDDDFVRYGNAPSWDGDPTDINPVALLRRGYVDEHTSYLMSVFNADQDLPFVTKGLKTRFLASFYNKVYASTSRNLTPFYFWLDQSDPTRVDEDGNTHYNMASIGPVGTKYLSTGVGRDGYREYSIQGAIEYNRSFLDKHNVSAIALYQQRERVDNDPDANEYQVLPYRQQGFAGRVTYDYERRYLMEANFGYNGSENFIRGHRWGFFPSLAAGWNISSEPFFAPLRKTISLMKLRASWGKSGNDVLDSRFPYITTVSTSRGISFFYGPNLTQAVGSTILGEGNPNATWEVSEKINVGFELGLFNEFTMILDLFRDNRTGIFMQRRSVPTSSGYAGTVSYANIGAVLNRGIDASLEYNKSFSRDLHVSVRGTFTYAHNEVTAQDEPSALRYPNTSHIGNPIDAIYGLVSGGLFSDENEIANNPEQTFGAVRPGDIKYQDITGDGRIDGNDISAIGYPTKPEIIYGIGPSIGFRKLDFSFFFQGVARVSLLMSNMHPFLDGTRSGYGITQWIADEHWRIDDPDSHARYPRLSSTWNQNNGQTSDYWIQDASFLRLKSAEVGYTYKKLRAYLSGTNLLTFSKFKLWDPEIGGGNGLSYPLQRTYTIGLQYNF